MGGEPEPEPEPEPVPDQRSSGSSAPTMPGDLPSPFSQNSRVRTNFEGLVGASETLSKQLVGTPRVVEHATSRGQKGGRTAMQHLVGDSSVIGELGTLLEHGGIYCEAMVTVDEHGDTIPNHGTRKAFYIIYCGIIDILQSYGIKKQMEAMGKALFFDGPAVSVSPPPFYGRRFRVYMTEYVFRPSVDVGTEVQVDMSQLKAVERSGDVAADELSSAVRQADISETIVVEDDTKVDLKYDDTEKKRQRTWRAHMRRRHEFEERRCEREADEGATASSSSFQSLAESVRQTVVVALLAQEGDPRTKIGHWRVKDVGGVKQACFKNQIASELCYNIALGVHYLLQKDPPEHEPDPFSYAIHVPSLGDKDSGIQPTHVPDFSFKIYKPHVFRRLRAQFGISETDFRNSLEATQQIGNPGASGSLLFKTADDLYIIKTLEKNEYTFILGILEKYVGHLTRMGGDVNSSLLVKFVGMFSIKKNRKIRLIAMQNSLPKQVLGRPPSLKFDLKGSAKGRKASESELAKKSKATLKDLDFERVFPITSGGLRIRPADYEKLAHRINQDARVLAELEIMDHSLLLGCYEIPQHCIRRVGVAHSNENRSVPVPAVPPADNLDGLSSPLPPVPQELNGRDEDTVTDGQQLRPTCTTSSALPSPGVQVERGEEMLL